jgi:Na+/pantothenate symporter
LFVPTIAGLWWKRANRLGGVASLVAGAGIYALCLAGGVDLGVPPIVVSLSASALAMAAGGLLGTCDAPEMREQIAVLHIDEPSGRP